ncbi:family 20 glycosylhydrolase [Arcanobacterium canis]|uniref:Family 20 glycosylhydrolase n=1 Tax=Arcanobacterium canis TaxID=999183 RepID=A0ABY8G1G7_9ACTO|nr:family 20 glycosylhydrolase [Arcanobacterium canis]WFM83923.1 family 20 glycosylhydrolase [Arcanobacterium canis]
MSTHKPVVASAAALALALGTVVATQPAAAAPLSGGGLNDVIPAVRHFDAAQGEPWRLTEETKIVAPSALKADAEKLALDLAVKGKIRPAVAVDGTADKDDIVLKVDPKLDVQQNDGYTIDSKKDLLIVTGKSNDGAFWGQQTVVQSVASAGGVQAGKVRDWADVSERSFHQDMARKYYDKKYIINLIHQMSYRKLNALQLHFSENEGFRLESKKHPEIMSKDGVITQAELKEILAEAAKYHVEIIPALDMPGHMRQALSAHPELRLPGNSDEARRGLDFSNKKSVEFVEQLIDEFAPLFPDTNKWHLGADEYVHFGKAEEDPFKTAEQRYPDVTKRVRQKLGDDKLFVDGFVDFINHMAKHLKKHNKTDVRVWNDAFYRTDVKQTVPLDKNVTVDYWTQWHWGMADVQTFADKGYKVINYNDAYMYWVLNLEPRAYWQHPTTEKIFEGFHSGRFPGKPRNGGPQSYPKGTDNPPVGQSVVYPEWLRGASFAIWSDTPDMLTQDEIADQTKGPYTAFADRVWYSGDSRSVDAFKAAMAAVGDAPILPANLDQLTVSSESALTADPASGSKVKAGASVAFTGVVKNTSSESLPVKAKVASTNIVTKAGNVPVSILDKDGSPVVTKGKNVALASEGATATVSSVEPQTNFDGSKAIDGDGVSNSSRWSSTPKVDNPWIEITFKEPTDLVKLRLGWEGAHATKYTVDFSHPQGEPTTETFTFDGSKGKSVSWAEHDVNQKQVTKIKITGLERSLPEYGISLFEVEAYSPGGPLAAPAAALDASGNVTWEGTLEPQQSAKFSWNGKVSDSAKDKASAELTSIVRYPLKPGKPSTAKAELILDTPAEAPKSDETTPAPAPTDKDKAPAPAPTTPAPKETKPNPEKPKVSVPWTELTPATPVPGADDKTTGQKGAKSDSQTSEKSNKDTTSKTGTNTNGDSAAKQNESASHLVLTGSSGATAGLVAIVLVGVGLALAVRRRH